MLELTIHMASDHKGLFRCGYWLFESYGRNLSVICCHNLNTNYCDIMAQDQKDALNGLSKEQLMDMVVSLQDEVLSLKDEFMKVTNLRLYHLERNHNMQAQYGRRESFEIAGIPQTVTNDELEDEVLDIAKEAKVFVNRQP